MKHTLIASPQSPVVVYYCKAGIQTGETIRILQEKVVHKTGSVMLRGDKGMFFASMIHDNSKGKPKASGARCVLEITYGGVEFDTKE